MGEIDAAQSIGYQCTSSQEIIDLRPKLILTLYINTSTFMQAESVERERAKRSSLGCLVLLTQELDHHLLLRWYCECFFYQN